MKPAARKALGPVGCLLLVAGITAVTTMDGNWFGALSSDHVSLRPWFASAAATEAHLPAPLEAAVEIAPRGTRLSLSEPMDATLFARPRNGWTLISSKTQFTSAWMTQQSGGAVTQPGGQYVSSSLLSSALTSATLAPTVSPASPASQALLAPAAPTATGIWTSNASGNWSTPINWAGGVVA